MSFHYWRNRGRPDKRGFVRLAGGYHGETLGALGVTDVAIFRDAYAPLLRAMRRRAVARRARRRAGERARPTSRSTRAAALDAHLAAHHATIAALIVEPLVQGAAGMAMYDARYLRARARAVHALRRAPDRRRDHDRLRPHRNDVRVRAGRHRAGLPVPVEGHHRRLPAAVVRALHRRRSTPRSTTTTSARGFLHSHSYTGNALACRAALAVLDIFRDDDVIAANRAQGARAGRDMRGAARRASARARFPPAAA